MGKVTYTRTGYVQVKQTDSEGTRILNRKESMNVIRNFTRYTPGHFKVGEQITITM